MFSRETYMERRKLVAKRIKSGILLFPGNGESGMNYKDNWYPFRQDSTFLYYTGIDQPYLYFLIDIDNDREILFGNDATPEEMVWIGAAEPLAALTERVGIAQVRPIKGLSEYLKTARSKGQEIHFLPPYRP